MTKQDQRITIMKVGRYRIIEKSPGIYRLQYKKKLPFFLKLFRKNPWRTIYIDFDDIVKLRVKMYTYEYKLMNKKDIYS